MIIPAVLGGGALILGVLLLVNDHNGKLLAVFSNFTEKVHMEKTASERLFSTLKGFLLIFCLVVIFATFVYYFG